MCQPAHVTLRLAVGHAIRPRFRAPPRSSAHPGSKLSRGASAHPPTGDPMTNVDVLVVAALHEEFEADRQAGGSAGVAEALFAILGRLLPGTLDSIDRPGLAELLRTIRS